MFTASNLGGLLNAQPFVPFRLCLSGGRVVEVRSREMVIVGRHSAIVGLLDPDATDTLFDRWIQVWYMHVTGIEQLTLVAPPATSSPGQGDAPAPSVR
jgi:hypothetical protein